MLPALCEHCQVMLSATYIMSRIPEADRSSVVDGKTFTVRCRACERQTEVLIVHVAGNPRNQILKLHMDGWMPHGVASPSKRSVNSIEVLSGCLSNRECGKTSNVFTLAFVPDALVPNGLAGSNFMSALFSFIVDEMVELYLDGIDVVFNSELPELQHSLFDSPKPEITRVRVILIALIADLPARAKLGGWKDGGVGGCYLCEAESCRCAVPQPGAAGDDDEEGVGGNGVYYYPHFVKHFSNRPCSKNHEYAENVRDKLINSY